jgi:hypothetical protein
MYIIRMRLSKGSKKLMMFLTKNKGINHESFTKKTINILSELYGEMLEAYNYLSNLKRSKINYYDGT